MEQSGFNFAVDVSSAMVGRRIFTSDPPSVRHADLEISLWCDRDGGRRTRRLVWRDGVHMATESLAISTKSFAVSTCDFQNNARHAHFIYALYDTPFGSAAHISGFIPDKASRRPGPALHIASELTLRRMTELYRPLVVRRLHPSLHSLDRARRGIYGRPLQSWLNEYEKSCDRSLDFSALYFLLLCLLDEYQSYASPSLTRVKLQEAQRRLTEDLARRPAINDVAAMLGMSASGFSHAFRRSCGESPLRWLMRKRIDRAMAILRSSETSLAEIALSCGFTNQAHFTRAFKDLTGQTPGSWRRLTSPANDV